MPDISTSISGVSFSGFVMNASGPNDSTLAELEEIAKSESCAVVMKSCTVSPRKGNEEPRFSFVDCGAIQSMGLPNLGFKKYVEFSEKLKKFGKPVVASVSGFSPEDYEIMVSAFQDSKADLIEVNLSCPNIKGKPQVAYDFSQSADILDRICGLGNKPIGVKLPAYLDSAHHIQMAELLLEKKVGFITCINSLGNALSIDWKNERASIKPRNGLGGLSGPCIKNVALGNVWSFRNLLKGKIDIMGVGGISSGSDAFEFLLAGASAVQVGTQFLKEGPSCFSRISNELLSILESKGYSSVSEVVGKLSIPY